LGSRNEKPGKEGLAHFMEHMPFRGTKNFPDKKSLAAPVEDRGGTLNAWTSTDHIVFLAKVAPGDAELGAKVLLELTERAKNTEPDFEKERLVVIEEFLDTYSAAENFAAKIAYPLLFPDHPLGHLALGELPALKSLTITDLRNFYQQCRGAKKALLVIGGGVSAGAVLSLLDRHFSQTSTSGKTIGKLGVITEVAEERTIIVADQPYSRSALFIGMHGIPGADFQTKIAAEIFFAMLGDGMSSPLFETLRERGALVYNYGLWHQRFEDAGVFSFQANTKFANTESARDKFWEAVRSTAKDPKRFSVAKEMLVKKLGMDTYALWNAISRIAEELSVRAPILSLQEEIAAIRKTSFEDVNRMAEAYFRREKSLTVIVKGQAE